MNVPPTRSYTRLAVAIIVAGVVIGAGIFASSYLGTATTVTRTSVETTTMFTTLLISTSTTSVQTATETSNVNELVFRQITPCPNIGYFAPWSVTLSNGQSVTALNANFSQPYSGSPNNPSIITFLIGNGNYSYSVTPPNRFTPGAGTVTVGNQEVVVNLGVFMASCGSSTTTTG
jgi:hypothetical protein